MNSIVEGSQNPQNNLQINPSDANLVVQSYRNEDLKKILDESYINTPDGTPLVWWLKLKGARNAERCYGLDLFRQIMISTFNRPVNHFFCGGQDGIAEQLKDLVGLKYSNKNVVGTLSPRFGALSEKEIKNIAEEINSVCTVFS